MRRSRTRPSEANDNWILALLHLAGQIIAQLSNQSHVGAEAC